LAPLFDQENSMSTSGPLPFEKNRLEAITDGVYAVAMTLLVIDLKMPNLASVSAKGGGDTQGRQMAAELVAALIQQQDKFVAWLISFLVVAALWTAQQRTFEPLKLVDRRLTWISICQLGFVSLMPFSSSLVGEYTALYPAPAIYAGNLFALGVFSSLTAWYIGSHPALLARQLTSGERAAAMMRGLSLVLVSTLAFAVSFIVPSKAPWAFTLLLPISWLFNRRAPSRP
jgi:uncharacterized membrane protein